ncbi:ABC transporter substrate-binding protein [Alloalcanivorax marinus]|uniref:ABC transporter substrate-binding protein n=1 Tax=Alloalcanivorax marinus TaxID=1177169 RepID=UPI001933E9E1|nr:ABC transporter substrate-binding protein [Alloalcanivorax marinus]MBL7250111.1 ABC transporter substrate-binding protein [Alloalcanivorax marinus]
MSSKEGLKLDRRTFLKGAAAAGAVAMAPAVLAKKTRNIKFTLPWLPQGATAYAYVAQDQGMFKKRGIEAEVTRGHGSLAAAQSIANKQFDFGLVSASSTILSAATGLPLVALGTTNYEAYLGALVRADSPIKTAKDLVGKRMGGVPSSVEFPLWKAFALKAGIKPEDVEIVQADPRILERLLVERKVDASYCVTSSSYAVAKGLGVETRAMLLSDYGMSFYSNNIVTRPEVLESDPQLCEDVCDALLEALAFTARDPQKAADILLEKQPQLALSEAGKENVRLSMGFMLASLPYPEAMDHALGYSDLDRVAEMTDLIMQYAAPESAKRPDPEVLFTNRFIGSTTLSAGEWKQVKDYSAAFPAMLSGGAA